MLKKIRNVLVGLIGSCFIRCIGPTLRMKVTDESGLIANPSTGVPIIFAFWHNRMFLMPHFYPRYLPVRSVTCLVSASQDGEMIARVLQRCGLGSVRGSSSRRSKEAYRELAESLKQGLDVAITPDGPRGPCYQAHVGVVGLAAFSGHKLIPVSYDLDWKITLRTWDRFMIPLPFSRCRLHLGKLMDLTGVKSDEELEKARQELERTLCGLGNSQSPIAA